MEISEGGPAAWNKLAKEREAQSKQPRCAILALGQQWGDEFQSDVAGVGGSGLPNPRHTALEREPALPRQNHFHRLPNDQEGVADLDPHAMHRAVAPDSTANVIAFRGVHQQLGGYLVGHAHRAAFNWPSLSVHAKIKLLNVAQATMVSIFTLLVYQVNT